ncbi:hypothetical protein TSUD_156580 [Trifolium subterraneum]|uniref:Uncharacterized protein n=1 Tax=Trifolium subterraneum TaxID=3900 RepID=A0A2Z6M9B7_TRISU|nr:hypothetical protein TSUD_156580 [Trifolium subterraneum]
MPLLSYHPGFLLIEKDIGRDAMLTCSGLFVSSPVGCLLQNVMDIDVRETLELHAVLCCCTRYSYNLES